MLRDLIATDVEAICEINKEALGYAFSSEETASRLARLSKDPHHLHNLVENDVGPWII